MRNLFIFFLTINALLTCVYAQKLLPSGEEAGDTVLSPEDWERGYAVADLRRSITIYGRGSFDQIYINVVGAVSFGTSLHTSNLDLVRNDILIFAPFLIPVNNPNLNNGIISYRSITNTQEKNAVKTMFQANIADDDFTVVIGLVVTYDYTINLDGNIKRNNFQFVLASDGERTYIRFAYKYLQYAQTVDGSYAKVGQFALSEGAITCANEVEVSGTAEVANLWTQTNTGSRGNFYWRVDLPLECLSFTSDCGEVDQSPEDFNICPIGYFMETVTSNMWQFYRLYFCKAGKTLEGGMVSVKQKCEYDSDYYTFEWRTLGNSDSCSVTLKDFFSSSLANLTTQMMLTQD
ncbi:nidogen-1-like [Clavelina lepadiformis]|uniref:nidogen-1-like n=1 Tax=Clavelina lepadiformis TaxID=159417 RepID=UPI0040427D9C